MKDAESSRLTELMEKRKDLIFPEPSLEDNHSSTRVHHPTLGKISRLFDSNTAMALVYNWVGSLNTLPVHFELLTMKRK